MFIVKDMEVGEKEAGISILKRQIEVLKHPDWIDQRL
jgi:hypothetical protein